METTNSQPRTRPPKALGRWRQQPTGGRWHQDHGQRCSCWTLRQVRQSTAKTWRGLRASNFRSAVGAPSSLWNEAGPEAGRKLQGEAGLREATSYTPGSTSSAPLQTPRLQTPLPALTGTTPTRGRVETASPERWRNRSCTHFSLPRLPHGGLIYTGDGAGEQGSVHLLGVCPVGAP